MIKQCHICGMPAEIVDSGYQCFRCGYYRISAECCYDIFYKSHSDAQVANASAWIRRNQGETITRNLWAFLSSETIPAVHERAEQLLLYFAALDSTPGHVFFFNVWAVNHFIQRAHGDVTSYDSDRSYLAQCEQVFPLLGVSASSSANDLIYLIFEYLKQHKRFLGEGIQDGSFTISPQGWDYIGSRPFALPQFDQAFVAMWFDESMSSVFTSAISPGIESAGYKPVRIDNKEHNNRIDDEIITEIKRSKFTVADFTQQRGGVYFEAGLTLGLGRQVIWLCKEDELEKVHFDTRQYNFIIWTIDRLDQLAIAIERRIIATIGQGNYAKPGTSH